MHSAQLLQFYDTTVTTNCLLTFNCFKEAGSQPSIASLRAGTNVPPKALAVKGLQMGPELVAGVTSDSLRKVLRQVAQAAIEHKQ